MTTVDEIRKRLEGVASIDWAVERQRDTEMYGDWVHVGPTTMPDFGAPLPAWETAMLSEKQRDEGAAAKREQDAVIEFLCHAADDIRTLLAEVDRLKGGAAG